eukprot:766016-Hanusia_phi.AAC.5
MGITIQLHSLSAMLSGRFSFCLHPPRIPFSTDILVNSSVLEMGVPLVPLFFHILSWVGLQDRPASD